MDGLRCGCYSRGSPPVPRTSLTVSLTASVIVMAAIQRPNRPERVRGSLVELHPRHKKYQDAYPLWALAYKGPLAEINLRVNFTCASPPTASISTHQPCISPKNHQANIFCTPRISRSHSLLGTRPSNYTLYSSTCIICCRRP